MTEYNYSDEIDLFELMETLWLEKKIIFLSVIFFLALFGSAYTLVGKSMTSEIAIDIGVYQDQNKGKDKDFSGQIYSDFASYFFNPSVFSQWKKSSQSSLNYDMISQSEVIDGLVVAKKKQSVSLVLDKKNNTAKVKVIFKDKDDLLTIDNYVSYVNQVMSRDYLKRAENNLNDVQNHITKIKEGNAGLVTSMLSIKSYIKRLKDLGVVLNKSYPTQPKNKLNPLLFAVLGLLIGFGVGCGYVLFRKSWRGYQERKQQLLTAQAK